MLDLSPFALISSLRRLRQWHPLTWSQTHQTKQLQKLLLKYQETLTGNLFVHLKINPFLSFYTKRGGVHTSLRKLAGRVRMIDRRGNMLDCTESYTFGILKRNKLIKTRQLPIELDFKRGKDVTLD